MEAMGMRVRQQTELHLWQHGAIFLFACAILITRHPDAIFHAQFWAEDGHVWFADSYNFGWWAALLRPQDGYFQTCPRLAASLALLVPLSMAPLALNLILVVAQALPVNLLLSARSSAWGSLRFRALMAAVYLALPNCAERSLGVGYTQWLMALSAFLILVGSAPRSIAGRIFNFLIVALSGLTGPFSVFLAPVALILAWRHRDRSRLVPACVIAACALVQVWGLLILNPSGRSHYAALGASPALFIRILARQIYLAALFGRNGLSAPSDDRLLGFLLCIAVAGTAIVALCFAKSAIQMKLFLIFSAVLFVASLISPNTHSPAAGSAWELLAITGGIRYWFFPTLAFAWSILWCLHSRIAILKVVAAYLLVFMCIGIVHDWRLPALQDLQFAESARRFEAAPAGTVVTFPLNPAGWNMQLVKRQSGK
ncbi:MAG: hypothetical protein ABSE99_00060 [Terracidiphilus sp.]|jgi:hypothetical protein